MSKTFLKVLLVSILLVSYSLPVCLSAPDIEFKNLNLKQIANRYFSERDLEGIEGIWSFRGLNGPVLIAIVSSTLPDIEAQYGQSKWPVGIMLQPDIIWEKGESRLAVSKAVTPHLKYEGTFEHYFVNGYGMKMKTGFAATFTLDGGTSMNVFIQNVGPVELTRLFPSRNPAPGMNGTGSGFFISPGLVVTNHHVIDNAQRVEVRSKDGQWVPAKVLLADADYDLAVLEVKGLEKLAKPLLLGNPAQAKVGQRVYSFGFPAPDKLSADISSMQLRMKEGLITSLEGFRGSDKEFQISIPSTGGNSGGPVVNVYGEVLAVVTSGLPANILSSGQVDVPQNINFARRISRAVDMVGELGRMQELSPSRQDLPEMKTDVMAEEARDSVVLVRSEGYRRPRDVTLLNIGNR